MDPQRYHSPAGPGRPTAISASTMRSSRLWPASCDRTGVQHRLAPISSASSPPARGTPRTCVKRNPSHCTPCQLAVGSASYGWKLWTQGQVSAGDCSPRQARQASGCPKQERLRGLFHPADRWHRSGRGWADWKRPRGRSSVNQRRRGSGTGDQLAGREVLKAEVRMWERRLQDLTERLKDLTDET